MTKLPSILDKAENSPNGDHKQAWMLYWNIATVDKLNNNAIYEGHMKNADTH